MTSQRETSHMVKMCIFQTNIFLNRELMKGYFMYLHLKCKQSPLPVLLERQLSLQETLVSMQHVMTEFMFSLLSSFWR